MDLSYLQGTSATEASAHDISLGSMDTDSIRSDTTYQHPFSALSVKGSCPSLHQSTGRSWINMPR